MRSLHQLYRLHQTSRSLHLPEPDLLPPRWYRLGFLVRRAAKKRGLGNFIPPFDQSPATC